MVEELFSQRPTRNNLLRGFVLKDFLKWGTFTAALVNFILSVIFIAIYALNAMDHCEIPNEHCDARIYAYMFDSEENNLRVYRLFPQGWRHSGREIRNNSQHSTSPGQLVTKEKLRRCTLDCYGNDIFYSFYVVALLVILIHTGATVALFLATLFNSRHHRWRSLFLVTCWTATLTSFFICLIFFSTFDAAELNFIRNLWVPSLLTLFVFIPTMIFVFTTFYIEPVEETNDALSGIKATSEATSKGNNGNAKQGKQQNKKSNKRPNKLIGVTAVLVKSKGPPPFDEIAKTEDGDSNMEEELIEETGPSGQKLTPVKPQDQLPTKNKVKRGYHTLADIPKELRWSESSEEINASSRGK